MYGILTDEEEQVDTLLSAMKRPVAHLDSTTSEMPVVPETPGLALADDAAAPDQFSTRHRMAAIPSEETEPSGTTSAKTLKPARGPERLVVDEGDERNSLILPLLRIIARSDIEAKAGTVMAAVLRESAELEVSRKSARAFKVGVSASRF